MRNAGEKRLIPVRKKSLPISLGETLDCNKCYIDLSASSPLIISGVCGCGKTIFLRAILLDLISSNPFEHIQIMSAKTNPFCDEMEDIISNHREYFCSNNSEVSSEKLLQMLIEESTRRLHLFAEAGFCDFDMYNHHASEPVPYLIVSIDNIDRVLRNSNERIVDHFFETVVRMWKHCGIILVCTVQSLIVLNPWRYIINSGSHIVFRTLDAHLVPFQDNGPFPIRSLGIGEHFYFSRSHAPIFLNPLY